MDSEINFNKRTFLNDTMLCSIEYNRPLISIQTLIHYVKYDNILFVYWKQKFLIKCTLNGYIICYMSAEFQKGLGWSRPLLSLISKYCLVILLITLTYLTLSDL